MSKEQLTEKRIAEIRSRLHGVSLGEWSHGYNLDVQCNAITCEGRHLFWFVHPDPLKNEKNMEFVAHSRQDMGALLAEVKRLREEVARQEQVIWFFSEAVKDFFRYEVKLGTPKEYKVEIGGEYPVANRETWNEPYWRKDADIETRGNPGNSGDVPESEQGE